MPITRSIRGGVAKRWAVRGRATSAIKKQASRFKIFVWGQDQPRHYMSDATWAEPLKWNREARKAGVLRRVFCASMADWAEGRSDQREHLERLWALQEQTESLIWMMLTKRPQLINKLCPRPRNPLLWHGTTTEDQRWLDIRWPLLKRVDAEVRWLCMEPLFEQVTLPPDFLALGNRAWVIVRRARLRRTTDGCRLGAALARPVPDGGRAVPHEADQWED